MGPFGLNVFLTFTWLDGGVARMPQPQPGGLPAAIPNPGVPQPTAPPKFGSKAYPLMDSKVSAYSLPQSQSSKTPAPRSKGKK